MIMQPYLNGPPRFDVGLRPIALEKWLTPDDQAAWLPAKNALIDEAAHDVFCQMPSSIHAQREAAQLIELALHATPSKSVSSPTSEAKIGDPTPVAHNADEIPAFRFAPAGMTPFDEKGSEKVNKVQVHNNDEGPFLAASRLVSDDLVIMENTEGQWKATACCLCSPTFFSAAHALGKTLAELHGPVPDEGFGLSTRIGRVFTALAPDTILERHNWTVQWSDARYTPDGTPLRQAATLAPASQASDQVYLRVERQTIRKLADTGAVLFTIRIRLTRLADLLADPTQRQAFETAWHNAPENVQSYKNWADLRRHVANILRN